MGKWTLSRPGKLWKDYVDYDENTRRQTFLDNDQAHRREMNEIDKTIDIYRHQPSIEYVNRNAIPNHRVDTYIRRVQDYFNINIEFGPYDPNIKLIFNV